MHIGYILGSFPVLSETFIRTEISALKRCHIPIDIVAFERICNERMTAHEQEMADIAVIPTELLSPSLSSLLGAHRSISFLKEQTLISKQSLLWQGAKLAHYGKQQGWTHIHTHFAWGAAAYAIVAAKMLSIPVTMTCHGSDIHVNPQDVSTKLGHVDAAIAVCDALANTLTSIRKECHIETISCGVDTDLFLPSNMRHNRLLFIGRLIDCKGVDDLLYALSELPQSMRPALDIVGDGILRNELEALSDTLGLQHDVSFLGARNTDWIRNHAPQYRGFVAAFREGNDGAKDTEPVVVKEAMAMGLPILSTHFMGIPNMVPPSCGILVPPKQRDYMAKALFQFQETHDEDILIMGQNARTHCINNFSVNKQIQCLIELWDKWH